MDMVDFDPIEEGGKIIIYKILFPEPVPYPLHNLIEFRIKLLLKNDAVFIPAETQVVNTSCMLKGKIRGAKSIHLIPYENLPLNFESGGYISQKYRVWVVT